MKRIVAMRFVFCAFAVPVGEVRGAVILDQSTPTTGFNVEIGFGASSPSQYLVGESFTVGVAGILDSLTLFVDYNDTAGTDLLEIRSTTGSGAPSANVLGSEDFAIPQSISGSTITIDVSSFNVKVTVGEKLFFDIGAHRRACLSMVLTLPCTRAGLFIRNLEPMDSRSKVSKLLVFKPLC